MNPVSINVNEIDWQVAEGYPDGAMQKLLDGGSNSAPRSFLLKINPGWRMEAHAHIYTELHYVLEGEYQTPNHIYPEGSFRIIPRHTNHGHFTTTKGAVILVVCIEGIE